MEGCTIVRGKYGGQVEGCCIVRVVVRGEIGRLNVIAFLKERLNNQILGRINCSSFLFSIH